VLPICVLVDWLLGRLETRARGEGRVPLDGGQSLCSAQSVVRCDMINVASHKVQKGCEGVAVLVRRDAMFGFGLTWQVAPPESGVALSLSFTQPSSVSLSLCFTWPQKS
jgi:hypothetical protein